MSIPADLQALVDRVDPAHVYSNFMVNLVHAGSGHEKRREMLKYIITGDSLPEDVPSDKKQVGQLSRAFLLRLPETKQAEIKSLLSHALVGGNRDRKSRRARKTGKSTRRSRNH